MGDVGSASAESSALLLRIDSPADGAWNMSVDEVLMERADEAGIATLRFYEWSPATLSLGYFQNAADRATHAASLACPLVRRSSGGGAIMHDRELTYSISLPTKHPLAADPETLYRNIHGTLLQTLAEFGVVASVNEEAVVHVGGDPFLCFQRRAVGDLVVGCDKVCGSAQRRRRGAILQHGSILLRRSKFAPELPGICDLSPASSAASKVTTPELVAAWTDRWRTVLGPLENASPFTPSESAAAETYRREKYGTETWTNRR